MTTLQAEMQSLREELNAMSTMELISVGMSSYGQLPGEMVDLTREEMIELYVSIEERNFYR